MIRKFENSDIDDIMQIWKNVNIEAHNFISKEYWIENCGMVREILPKAEIYVHEDDVTNIIDGFIGLTDNYIEGLFVKENVQSKGIGKQLLDYVKNIKSNMSLSVYMKNVRAVYFYQREQFQILTDNIDANTNEKELIMIWNK